MLKTTGVIIELFSGLIFTAYAGKPILNFVAKKTSSKPHVSNGLLLTPLSNIKLCREQ